MLLATAVNLPTIIVGVIVAALFAAIVIRGIVKRKRGEGGCGCCPNRDLCHKENMKHK